MKHVFSFLSVACVVFFTLFLSTTNVSCKKGDTGPKGDTGVANVVYSPWFDVTLTNQGDTIFYKTLDVPKLTQDVLDKGDIKVYFNFGSSAQPDVSSLPYFDGGLIMNTSYDVGHIYIVANANASSITSSGAKIRQYRYVLLTGSVPARQAVNWSNYEEVKKAYNITD